MAVSTQQNNQVPVLFRDRMAVIWSYIIAVLSILIIGWGIYMIATPPVSEEGIALTRNITGGILLVIGGVIANRYRKVITEFQATGDYVPVREIMKIDMIQAFLLVVLFTVMFPVLWILSMSLDPRGFSRPTGLTIIPPGASLESHINVIQQPTTNPVGFGRLLINSLMVAGGTSLASVVVGTSAAYAFSRMSFPGRKAGMLGFVLVLMIPPAGTLAPLFVLLNSIRVETVAFEFNLRTSLWGLVVAYTSTALPFAIWNMKGFIDSLPYELEEAAMIDGCNRTESFIRVILPLALPGMAVTAMMGFLNGWSEFIIAWTFLSDPQQFTLPMVLRGMIGQYASATPWAEFAAMSILMSIPPIFFFFFLQRYLVSGLAVGGVKG